MLPNGKTTVVDQSQPDLFFALKGGLNRFGIVTHAVYYTNQQPDLIYVSAPTAKVAHGANHRLGRLQHLLT